LGGRGGNIREKIGSRRRLESCCGGGILKHWVNQMGGTIRKLSKKVPGNQEEGGEPTSDQLLEGA